MLHYDYARHNEAVRRLWESERAGTPKRVRMEISCNPRMVLSDPQQNPEYISFEQYMGDPAVMLEVQCRFQEYKADSIFCDQIMGFDNLTGFGVYPDFQNVLESSYFGGSVAYHGIQEPGTRTFLTPADVPAFVERPFPSVENGLSGRALEYRAFFTEQQRRGFSYRGKPLTDVGIAGLSTDGPFTLGCCLLGATELCLSLYTDEALATAFLDYITDATIYRIKETRKAVGLPEKSPSLFLADDSIAMLSPDDYRRFVLPLHKKLLRELSTGEEPTSIHLCGDATRHFLTMRDELNARCFDTGYPVEHGRMVRLLGPEVMLQGGVHVQLLLNGSPAEIRAETKRILDEVTPWTHRFVIKEANNLSPGTPPEHLLAMYEAVQEFGRYPD